MAEGIKTAIRALALQLDDERMRRGIMDVLDGKTAAAAPAVSPKPLRQELLSGKEAAMVLNCTQRTVSTFARRGIIRKAMWPGRKHAFGYTRESVEALAAGRGV